MGKPARTSVAGSVKARYRMRNVLLWLCGLAGTGVAVTFVVTWMHPLSDDEAGSGGSMSALAVVAAGVLLTVYVGWVGRHRVRDAVALAVVMPALVSVYGLVDARSRADRREAIEVFEQHVARFPQGPLGEAFIDRRDDRERTARVCAYRLARSERMLCADMNLAKSSGQVIAASDQPVTVEY